MLTSSQALGCSDAIQSGAEERARKQRTYDQAAAHIIQRLEAECEVNRLVFRGFRFWPWVRNELIRYYLYRSGSLAERVPHPPKLNDLNLIDTATSADCLDEYLSKLKWSARHMAEHSNLHPMLSGVRKTEVLFVSRRFDRNRNYNIQGRSFNTVLDPIIRFVDPQVDWLKISLLAANATADDQHFAEARIDSKSVIWFIRRLDDLYHLLLCQGGDEVHGLGNLVHSVAKCGVEIPVGLDPVTLATNLVLIDYFTALFRLVLAKARPRLVFFVGQNTHTFSVARACYEYRIPCVDIQHCAAALSPANIKWFGWQQVPDGGYELLPDYFWVWSELAAERIQTTMGGARNHHVPIVGGNLWLRGCSDLLPGASLSVPCDDFGILVTLPKLAIDPVPDHLIDAMAQGPTGWRWLLRLHPSDAKNSTLVSSIETKLASRKITNFDVRGTSSTPLPSLLERADRHVSLYSSSCVEATAFGKGTIFIHERAADVFQEFMNAPGYDLALTAADIIAALSRPAVTPRSLVVSGVEIAEQALARVMRGPARGAGVPKAPH